MVWYGPIAETANAEKAKNLIKKSTDFTELRKITSRIYSKCSNYSYLFSSPSNFIAVRFVSLKQCTINCTSVLLISFFAS